MQSCGAVKQPFALHHRALMALVAFAFIYLVLWILHLLYWPGVTCCEGSRIWSYATSVGCGLTKSKASREHRT